MKSALMYKAFCEEDRRKTTCKQIGLLKLKLEEEKKAVETMKEKLIDAEKEKLAARDQIKNLESKIAHFNSVDYKTVVISEYVKSAEHIEGMKQMKKESFVTGVEHSRWWVKNEGYDVPVEKILSHITKEFLQALPGYKG